MKVLGMARFTRDPEVRYSQGAKPMAVARFSIAANRKIKREGEPDADFFNCVAFGGKAEFIEKHMRKGTKVYIEGTLQQNSYTNKDGQKVYEVRILVDDIEFAESKAAAGGNNGGGNNTDSHGDYGMSNSSLAGEGFMNIPEGIDEELPFN